MWREEDVVNAGLKITSAKEMSTMGEEIRLFHRVDRLAKSMLTLF